MKLSCIYWIRNILDDKIYIGYSSNYFSRKTQHLSLLRANKHHNKHLQNAYNKDSEDAFVFQIIELCEKDHLPERENFWCKRLNSCNMEYGYNIADTFDDYRMGRGSGWHHTQEAKDKVSNANRGISLTYEERLHLKKFSKSKDKIIQIFDMNNNLIHECPLARDAANFTNTKISVVYNQLCGISGRSKKGFIFKYKEVSIG